MNLSEFEEFKSHAQAPPPHSLTQAIFNQIRSELNPSPWLVFAKLAFIQIAVGLVTLLYCPQFGLSPLGHEGLVPELMHWGEHTCMFFCGAIFLGTSALVASFVLSRDEVRVLRKKEVLQILAVSLMSVAVFLCAGAEVAMDIALFWLLGAIIGGLGLLELGLVIRSGLGEIS